MNSEDKAKLSISYKQRLMVTIVLLVVAAAAFILKAAWLTIGLVAIALFMMAFVKFRK